MSTVLPVGIVVGLLVLACILLAAWWFRQPNLREIPCESVVIGAPLGPFPPHLSECLFCLRSRHQEPLRPQRNQDSDCKFSRPAPRCASAAAKPDQAPSPLWSRKQDESGSTAEERQNNQNAGLEGEESRPESRPLLQETQPGMTKASPPLEDEDRGLGDSLPNTTNSSQTSLSGLPTLTLAPIPRQSPPAIRLATADVVRSHFPPPPLLW